MSPHIINPSPPAASTPNPSFSAALKSLETYRLTSLSRITSVEHTHHLDAAALLECQHLRSKLEANCAEIQKSIEAAMKQAEEIDGIAKEVEGNVEKVKVAEEKVDELVREAMRKGVWGT